MDEFTADPCPTCKPDTVCRTPSCGRLKGKRQEPVIENKQAEPVAWVDPLPEGWKATNAGPCKYLTDEANRERRVQVERVLPPFEGKDRLRSWFGPDLYTALKKAHESLGLEYETQAVACSFPERDVTKPAEAQGLFRKFDVRRVDGSDAPGGKHHGCEYFVLDLDHDIHAPAAIRAYAQACNETHPQLSAELSERFGPQPAVAQEPVGKGETLRESLFREFPLLEDHGLDEVEHHCEWNIQQERKRLHALLNKPPAVAIPVGCAVSQISSRMCERGTKGCVVEHESPAVAVNQRMRTALQEIANTVNYAQWYQETAEKALEDANHTEVALDKVAAVAVNEQLYSALEGLLAITRDSQGVAGYHLNGVVAKWDEFEEVSAAGVAIAAAEAAKGGAA